ncbi:multidrug and toxin extrusion protein 1-like isoform X2 [Dunckerocampus dactyliophorus]|uniref:multidrug and toxin extrusion protein 1-like isoform X2 n=1 Tax=Dunckerocampus dactyliophorus TaxID=161453 RepID=UPI002407341B|nr:multidrug and toxin extrusion protein 1-like isoform X2 [Dunckerocampus dactyliophorus]
MDGDNKTLKYSEGVREASEANGAASPSFCSGRVGLCIPLSYRNELIQLFKLAGPVVISQMMVFMISLVSTVFCGHLGKTELAAVSLSIATYGSGNLKRVGVILQRGILILLLACFPCWAVLIQTEPLLLAVKQSPDVARLSQLYVKIFMPALPAAFMYQLQGRYLQNQGIIWPQVITGVIGNILNAVNNYVFLYPLDLGVAGSAAANAISQYLLAVVLFVYICWRGLHKATWEGWSLDCLQEWGPFVKLAVPSMLMLCLEWWMFEVGGVLAGLISEAELGAQAVAYQLTAVAYMFPLGFSAAASVRVGNALGAGNMKQAWLACKVPIICAFITSCFIGASFSLSRKVVGYIFTTEQDILKRVADVMVVFGFMHVADAVAGVSGGVIRGAGKQKIGAVCNLVGYYFIGFPIGASLMFAAGMGIVGLWTGLTVCVLAQSIFFITYLHKLDWQKAAEEARFRAGVQVKVDKDVDTVEDLDSVPKLGKGTAGASSCESAAEDHAPQEIPDQRNVAATIVGDVLSGTQLLLRRGLTLLIMVVILVVGILTSDFLTGLLK